MRTGHTWPVVHFKKYVRQMSACVNAFKLQISTLNTFVVHVDQGIKHQ